MNTVITPYSEVLNIHYMVNLDENGQKSSLYSETSPYSEEIPYSEPFSLIHYKEHPLHCKSNHKVGVQFEHHTI